MNYYELLGIESNATEEEIKRAYKIQMKKWHPDINKDEEAMSISMKINEAKDTLLDEVKRREYDEFLKHKDDVTYQKYSNSKSSSTNASANYSYNYNNDEVYETKKVTKWEYLKDYMNNANINGFRKAITFILVVLESFMCAIIKYFIIGTAFLCFFLGDMIITLFNWFAPVLFLFLGILTALWFFKGTDVFFNEHMNKIIIFLVVVAVYISSYLFIFIGRKLLSQKVFNFLYNKLDIYLFKKAVGYN